MSSNTDDPFSQLPSDRTFIMPAPGTHQARAQTTPASGAALGPEIEALESLTPTSGLNPLVAAASPLLNIVPQLRVMHHADPEGLREALALGIRTFESKAKAAGVASEKVIAARYALCTLLDETAASTPWGGGSGAWAKQSLLVTFHNETWGGEKFFQLLARLAENPAANLDGLELMYVCLALGLEGRYRVVENGRAQLDSVRERLAQMLRNQRGDYERELSPHWQGADIKRNPILSTLPLWVAGAVMGVLLVTLYVGLSFALNRRSDPVFTAIQAIRARTFIPESAGPTGAPLPSEPLAPSKQRMAAFLQPEIRSGVVDLKEFDDRSIVVIRDDGFFQLGGVTVAEKSYPVLDSIARALNSVPSGKVLITGHTDNEPVRTPRFPSNWHLSLAKAESVQQLLAHTVKPAKRLAAEGRGDSEPVAPNDTVEGRAENRRIEITLFVPSSGV